MCYLERRKCDWRGRASTGWTKEPNRGGKQEAESPAPSLRATGPEHLLRQQDVAAAGLPAPPPGTERKKDGGVAQTQTCSALV